MRKLIFFITLFIFSCKSSLEHLKKYDGLNGKPTRVELIMYKIDLIDSIPIESMAYKQIEFYDIKGRKVRTLKYKSDGTPSTGGIYYHYDKYGNLKKSTMYNRDSTINTVHRYQYDKKGREVEKVFISRGDIKTLTRYIFNDKTRTERIIVKSGDGRFKENAIRKYDNNWKQIELISYDSLGKPQSRTEFEYDRNGNLSGYYSFDNKNQLYKFSRKFFNKFNDPTIFRGYKVVEKDTTLNYTTKIEYLYDKKKNIIEEKLFSDEKLIWRTKYNYQY